MAAIFRKQISRNWGTIGRTDIGNDSVKNRRVINPRPARTGFPHFQKHWAEWFTVIITRSLVPVEVYELYHFQTAIKILVLIINNAVVVPSLSDLVCSAR